MQSEEYIGPSRGDLQIIKEELNIVSANEMKKESLETGIPLEEEFISETTTTTDVNNYIIYEIQELQRFDNDLVKVEENCLPDDGSGRLETKKKRFSYEEYYKIKGNNFICLKCSNSTSFKNRIEIIYHIRRAHFGLKYNSAKRKKANPDRQVLKKHFKNEHLNTDGKERPAKPWEQCNITEIVTNKQCKQFYKAERGYFICLKCTNLKKFKCRNAIIYHIRREHFGVIFECPECKREFVNRYRLKKHFKNTHRETAGSGHEEHFNVADASAMESGAADIEQPSGSTCNAENKIIFSEKMHRCSFKEYYKNDGTHFICLKCRNSPKFKYRGLIIRHIRNRHFEHNDADVKTSKRKKDWYKRYAAYNAKTKQYICLFENCKKAVSASTSFNIKRHYKLVHKIIVDTKTRYDSIEYGTKVINDTETETLAALESKEELQRSETSFSYEQNSSTTTYADQQDEHSYKMQDSDCLKSPKKKLCYKKYAIYNEETKKCICLIESCKKEISNYSNLKRHYKLVHNIVTDEIEELLKKTDNEIEKQEELLFTDTEDHCSSSTDWHDQAASDKQVEHKSSKKKKKFCFCYKKYATYNEETRKCICLIESCKKELSNYYNLIRHYKLVHKIDIGEIEDLPKKKDIEMKKQDDNAHHAVEYEPKVINEAETESAPKNIRLEIQEKPIGDSVECEPKEINESDIELLAALDNQYVNVESDNAFENIEEELQFTDTSSSYEDHGSSSSEWYDPEASDIEVERKSSKKKKRKFWYKKYAIYNEETKKCTCLIESCKKELSNYYNLIRHYKLVHKIVIGRKKVIEMEKQDDNTLNDVEYEPKVNSEAEAESAPKDIKLQIQDTPIDDSVECEPKVVNDSGIETLAVLENQYVNLESNNAVKIIKEELQLTDTSSSYEDHGSSSSEWYDPEASDIEVERKSSKKKKKFWYKKYAIYNEETKKCTCLIESCKKELSNYYNLIRHYKLVHKIVIGRKKVIEMEKQDDNTLNVVEYEPKVNNEAEAESAPKDIKLQIQDNPIDDSVECEPKVVNDSGIETLAVLENQYVNLESNNAVEIIKEELQLTDTSSSYEDHGSSSSECYDQEASDIEVERKSSKKKKKFCYKKYAIYNEETKKCTCLIESCKKELSNYYNLIRHYKLVHKIVIGGKKDIEMEKQDDNAFHTIEYEPIVINEVETESVPKDTKLQIHENPIDDFAECEPKVINESEIETLAVIENQYVNLESKNAFEIVKEEFSYKDQCNSSTEWHDQETSAVEHKSTKKKKKFSYKKYATFNQETKKFICLIESCKRELTYDNSNLKRHYKLVHKILIDGKETLPEKTHIEMEKPDDIAYNIVDCKPKGFNEAEVSDPVECEPQVINKPSSFSYEDHRNSSPDCHDQAPASAGIQITDKIPFHQSNKMQRGHYSKLFKTNKKKKIKKNKMKTIIKRKQEFLYKKYATCNEETKKFTCLVCKRVISAMNSNLRRHYKLVHNRVIEIEETLPKAIKNIYTRLKTTLNREEFLKCCIGLVSTENLPLRIFDDNVFFKKLLKPYEEKFETPLSSRSISNILDGSSQQILSNIANNVKNKMICLKIDIASRQDSHILALNIQYISDFKIRINTIGMIKLNETHTAQHLKEEIMKCLEEYNINIKQIYCYTTDNGTNVLRVSELLQESQNANITKTVEDDEIINSKTYDGIETLLSTVFSVVRCPAHTIQLVAYDVIGTLEAEIKNVRNIAKIIHTIVSMGNLNINLPCLDNTTKWYTTYDMILSILKLKEYINNPNKSAKISVNWIFVERFAIAFKPLAECTLNMQKQQYTFGDFFRDWLNCELDLEDIMETNSIAKALHKAMVIRKSKLLAHDAFVAALYLDPRFNFQGTPLLTNDQQKRAMNHLLKTYETINPVSHSMSSQGENENIPIAEGSSDNTPSTSNSAYSRLLNRVNQLVNTSNSTTKPKNHDIKKELLAMCEKPMEPFETDVLKFWEQISLQNTKLTQLAEVVLAVPATQVSVERTFSAFATVLTKSRSKPSQEYLFNNLITQLNFDLLNCSELKIENNE